MKLLRSISLIINYKTFVITLLAIVSTWLCDRYNFEAEFPLTLIGIAIVFPVVFSIDSAYKRRERALDILGDFKAHAMAIYHASRDWVEPVNLQFQAKIKNQLIDIYFEIRTAFTEKAADDSQIYIRISELSLLIKEFRTLGLASGEVSRVSQYISKITGAIERLRVILHYRTPVTLRAYSKIFIYSFPIIYGPYFAAVAEKYSHWLEYVMPVIFSFILVSLDNIQGHLEDPFDQVGEDDIKFDVENFSKLLN